MRAFDLKGRRALVTGASSGLGRHFAMVLAEAGAEMVLAARRVQALEEARETVEKAGGRATVLAMDVADPTSVNDALVKLDGEVDVLVNAAGFASAVPAMSLSEAGWDQLLDTNLKGAFLVSQRVAARMKAASTKGTIINIASIAGMRVAGNLSAYGASKAGLIQLTKSLALEWARFGIRVNALCPGYFETALNTEFFATDAGQALINRIPQRRLGQPEELDGALLLLASDLGSYITGTTIVVDGGHMVSSL